MLLSGDDIVCLFSVVISIVVVGLTVVVESVVVVTAASTVDALFLGDYRGPPLFFVGVVPRFCFFFYQDLLLLLL